MLIYSTDDSPKCPHFRARFALLHEAGIYYNYHDVLIMGYGRWDMGDVLISEVSFIHVEGLRCRADCWVCWFIG